VAGNLSIDSMMHLLDDCTGVDLRHAFLGSDYHDGVSYCGQRGMNAVIRSNIHFISLAPSLSNPPPPH
jgi:hypothetical protein